MVYLLPLNRPCVGSRELHITKVGCSYIIHYSVKNIIKNNLKTNTFVYFLQTYEKEIVLLPKEPV